ncbi:glycosyltransferase [Effusibacillus consociatus]|uniref:Glycosyltransferase n=1 Tax=Effusibacillus consociatus TaxID=1117041 RepID=A0ABV9PWD9_9BACL
MRILLTTYWPLPHIGGVSTYVETLYNRLADMGHEVDILAHHPDLTKFYLLKQGEQQIVEKNSLRHLIEPALIEGYRQYQMTLTPWMTRHEAEKYAFEMACRQIGLDSYDLIHTQDIFSTFSCSRAKPAPAALVATIHGCLATEWIVNGEIHSRTPLEQEYLALEEFYGAMPSDHLILPSQWLSKRLSSFRISHPKTHIIPYGIDPQMFGERLRPTGQIPEKAGRKVIACPARLVTIKGQIYLLRAMQLLIQQRNDIVCWLIGDGVMRRDLEKQVEQLGLQNHVVFLGDRSDVPALLSLADLVVLPSLQDNLPFAVIEAQTVGKPVIASKVGGIVELIEDLKNGMLVEPKDIDQLYQKTLLLLNDEDLYTRISQEAIHRARAEWHAEVMAERTLSVYRKALDSKRTVQNSTQKSLFNIPDLPFALDLKERYGELKKKGLSFPNAARLGGRVRINGGNKEVPEACVHLIDMAGVVLNSVRTNQNGEYLIRDVQPGNYALTCLGPNIGTQTIRISVPAAGFWSFDLEF